MNNFFQELQRRNVIKAGITYVVVSWAVIQVCQILFETFEIPTAALRYIFITLLGGLPLWLIFAYRYEWTPTGFKYTEDVAPVESVSKKTSSTLTAITFGAMALAIILLVTDRFFHFTDRAKSVEVDKSIAVLPFADMSPGKDQEYFSDGLSEELLNLLAKIPGLKVTARTSSFSFKGKNEDLRVIGKKLGVAHVLEGSVRKDGDQMRITAQLIRVDDGTHLWSETYDRKLEGIFKVQDEISAAIVEQLKLKLLPTQTPQAKAANPEAYNLWLEGKYFADRRNKESFEKAIDKYNHALALDSTFAPAWAGLAGIYSSQASKGYIPLQEGYAKAKAAVNKALRLDPQFSVAYAIQGANYTDFDWDWMKADAALKKALELDPSNPMAMSIAGSLALSLGRLEEAISFHQQAIALDPLRAATYLNLAIAHYYSGRLEEAEGAIRKVLELSPSHTYSYYLLALIQLAQGKPEAALESIRKESDDGWRTIGFPMVYHGLNRQTEAEAALKELIEKYAEGAAYQIAEAYAYRGEKDKAFEWLERAYQQRDPGLTEMKGDPLMANLFNDARWQLFLKKMKLDGQ